VVRADRFCRDAANPDAKDHFDQFEHKYLLLVMAEDLRLSGFMVEYLGPGSGQIGGSTSESFRKRMKESTTPFDSVAAES
jgi:hypothetical protein